jgi:hypothetical protein
MVVRDGVVFSLYYHTHRATTGSTTCTRTRSCYRSHDVRLLSMDDRVYEVCI